MASVQDNIDNGYTIEEKHKSPEQVIIMIINTRSDHIQENNIKVKSRFGTYQLKSCYFRSRDPEQW